MTVEIPKSLVERLQGLGPHFIRVSKRGKEPIDKSWTTSPLFADDPKLQDWLKEGGNYGVIGGFGLVIVDVDLEELKQTVGEKLPQTFTVQSPGSKGWHLYYLCSLEKPIRLRDKEGENIGDIQGQGKMVVGPGSVHSNGSIYKVVDSRPLAQVTRKQLVETFKEFVVPNREIERVEVAARLEKRETKIELDILQVVPLAGLHKRGAEYFGPHPVHSSTTKQNFWVNTSKNCWHCFRHGSGGGPLLWLAVEEGIIPCAKAGAGVLRGEVFKQVLQKARERGLIKESPDKTREESKQDKKKKPKPTLKDSGVSDQGPFEAIYHNDLPAFLVKSGDSFEVWNQLTCNGAIYEPKDVKRIPYMPYGYFKGSIPNRDELFWKIRNEFHSFIDVEAIWKDVLSACVLLSYQQEKLLTVPYIFLYGDNESGKSTVLQILKFLCYRPMYGVTVPAADIYGYLDDVDSIGCVLEDEVQGIRKDIDKIKIYKAGYKQGAVVPRTIITQHNRIIRYYNTFSFKACASERIPQVKGFRERFVEISMVEGYPEKEWTDVTKEDLKRLYDLRDMLLKWRLLSKEWQLPNPIVSMRGRLKELWKPILQITHGLTVYETLANFIEDQKNERLNSKQNTLEGHIVKIVTGL